MYGARPFGVVVLLFRYDSGVIKCDGYSACSFRLHSRQFAVDKDNMLALIVVLHA
jgi:hypothetical protein